MLQLIANFLLYALGTGALLTSYLAFSPMTRDLVVFLSRDQQITIFKYRRLLWAVGIACLAALLLRALLPLFDGPTFLGVAHWAWLIITVPTVLLLSLAFWAMYVPVVMAAPKRHIVAGIAEADGFLQPDSIILGLAMGDKVRAYPRDLIARPHWFNDEVGGRPVMISYCILCNSGQAFIPVLKNGARLDLRNMTAFDNNTIYHCNNTGNFIQQLDARVISGPDEGETLESFPVIMARWDEWKRLHPETDVFYAPPETLRDRIVQKMLMTMIPLSRLAARDEPWHLVRKEIDTRLPAMSFVFGVQIAGDACAYPVTALADNPVVNDTVGGEPVAVFYDAAHDIGQVFSRRAGDRTLTFTATDSAIARDEETGSTWSVSGKALGGELAGTQLDAAPHWNQLFWFSWAAFKPGTKINTGDPSAQAAA